MLTVSYALASFPVLFWIILNTREVYCVYFQKGSFGVFFFFFTSLSQIFNT